MKKIMRNQVMCYRCGSTIESKHVHDYVTCKCGTVAVDGGHEYLKRVGDPEYYQELSVEVPEELHKNFTEKFRNVRLEFRAC